jgi:poly(A) polymerase
MKKFWNNLKSQMGQSGRKNPAGSLSSKAEIIPASEHHISVKDISASALKVIRRLNDAGYAAYLVGGSVRDLLLGKHPKDFDVTTDASPEQIRRLFSNSRIIGRRFRLVHVRYGREIVEVATFRGQGMPTDGDLEEDLHLVEEFATNEDSEQEEDWAEITQQKESSRKAPQTSRRPEGMLVSDNVYGTIEEDAARRDFTINALFYRLKDSSVIDYCQGMTDLASQQIRVIGNPEQRYREDPVRILRAIRFAAKLGFTIEKQSADPIIPLANLLSHVPPARLYDELVKLIVCGHSRAAFDQLQHYGILKYCFPQTHSVLLDDQAAVASAFINRALDETDARIAAEKTINPAFMIAILLWQPLQNRIQSHLKEGNNLYVAMQLAQNEVIRDQLHCIAAPRRTMTTVREIWILQYQLAQTRKYRILRAFEHPRFRAGYDFLLLRAQAGEPVDSLAQWWTHFQTADTQTQEQMIAERQNSGSKSGPKRRRSSPTHRRLRPRHRQENPE